jgi:DNA-binding NarL/FixJ family response regulator
MNIEHKRIIICEDHSIIRLGLNLLIHDLYPNATIEETDELEHTLTILNGQKADLLVLDINIPGGDNFNMISLIRQKQPEIRILIFSAYEEHIYAIPYLNAGVNGFVSKDASHDEFKKAVMTVMQDERYMSSRVREQQTDLLLNKGMNPFDRLSEREVEIMNLLSKGYTIKEISERLHISGSTVSTYKARIFEKLGVDNIIDMTQKAQLATGRN